MLPTSLKQRVANRRRLKKKKRGRPMSPNAKVEAAYRRSMRALVDDMTKATTERVYPQLYRHESAYTADSYASEINTAIDLLAKQARDITGLARSMATMWAKDLDETHRASFYRNVNTSIGINLENIINEDNIRGIVATKIEENVALIQSIPDEYFKKLRVIVNGQISRKQSAKSIVQEIQSLTGVSRQRAKLIARDQTSKLNAAITQGRQTALGITEYEWRTSDDERVRPEHKANNGKIFTWKNPPKTGHPGEDIQCRCVAIPIINISEL